MAELVPATHAVKRGQAAGLKGILSEQVGRWGPRDVGPGDKPGDDRLSLFSVHPRHEERWVTALTLKGTGA
jgi:hypothetical protein